MKPCKSIYHQYISPDSSRWGECIVTKGTANGTLYSSKYENHICIEWISNSFRKAFLWKKENPHWRFNFSQKVSTLYITRKPLMSSTQRYQGDKILWRFYWVNELKLSKMTSDHKISKWRSEWLDVSRFLVEAQCLRNAEFPY